MAILQINVRSATSDSHSNRSRQESNENDSLVSGGNGNAAAMPIGNNFSELTNHADLPESPIWQKIIWTLMPGTTVGRAIIAATQRLKEAGCETPHLDAQVLLAHTLGVERSWLFAHHDYRLRRTQTSAYTEFVARRVAAEPVAYLIGRKEFYGLGLEVDRRVLIPRPETELLVDAVLDHVESRPDKAISMVDVGTGSGAIALAVAANCPEVHVHAVDVSEQALTVARRNIELHGLMNRVTLLSGDLLSPLVHKVDVIAANLPYINSREYDELDEGVRTYEPSLALEGGSDGLDVIKRLLAQAPECLRPGGVIFLEIGYDQGESALEMTHRLIPQAKYVGLRQDYHGHDRLVVIGL